MRCSLTYLRAIRALVDEVLRDMSREFDGLYARVGRRQFVRHPRAYEAELKGPPRAVQWATRLVAYSGTSGMIAALNGVPSISVLDSWWREGCVEGVTGWAIGTADPAIRDDTSRADAADLYHKLQAVIAPLFYDDRPAWIRIMRQCIALNASFFNTHRMVRQYVLHAYSLGEES